MAVPSNYRWVSVGSLLIRSRANAADNAPEFGLDDLYQAIEGRFEEDEQYRVYAAETRLMWCEQFNDAGDYFKFLIETGDKNVAGVSFIHFGSKASRDVDKEDEEGGHYSAHVLIKKEPEGNGRHMILVERVPGIYLSSVKDHFSWACNDPAFEKQAPTIGGGMKSYRAVFEIDGFQSRTVRDALMTGTLKDIEFISFEEMDADGHDEDQLVEEVVREARWKVGKRLNQEQATGLFARAVAYMDEFTDDPDDRQMLVRIKTASGQVKTTEIDLEQDAVLEQAFVQNEVISDFDHPLPARHDEFNPQVIQKMSLIAGGGG